MTDADRGLDSGRAGSGPELSPADERLVRRIDAAWRAPAASPERRVAFQRRLDERIAASRGLWGRHRLASAAMAAGVALLAVAAYVVGQRAPVQAPRAVATAVEASARGEAIFALATEDVYASAEDDLPDDYVAIASLLVDY
jgi:hypothetical protein